MYSSNSLVESSTKSIEVQNVTPKIAKWYNNYDCAISLRFDDNLDSHIKYVIPVLNALNFKATFMTNPGRNNLLVSYDKHKEFWENEVPAMGHRLGNHTIHHHGAKNLEEAEYEIGEAAKLIWKLFPKESKLNVFASGGGEKWNGKRWSKTDPEIKSILQKYYLIDLYFENNIGLELNSNFCQDYCKGLVDQTLSDKSHLPLIFHKVGNKNLFDIAKEAVTGFNNCITKDQFLDLMEYLNLIRNRVWVAPIVQIIKYSTELLSAKLKLIKSDNVGTSYEFLIGTNPKLYDQELSLIIPTDSKVGNLKFYQNNRQIKVTQNRKKEFVINIIPENSKIEFKRN